VTLNNYLPCVLSCISDKHGNTIGTVDSYYTFLSLIWNKYSILFAL